LELDEVHDRSDRDPEYDRHERGVQESRPASALTHSSAPKRTRT
jgi:hypothetical protein